MTSKENGFIYHPDDYFIYHPDGCFICHPECIGPLLNLWWYGMNGEGLEIPKDYSKSAAAIYVLED